MSAVAVGIEKGYIEKAMGEREEDELYIIHQRMILNEYILKSIFDEFMEEGFSIIEVGLGNKKEFAAEKKHKSYLWVNPSDDIPDVGEDVEIITDKGYQRKSVYVVDKYGEQFFDIGEIYIPLEEVVVWRKL